MFSFLTAKLDELNATVTDNARTAQLLRQQRILVERMQQATELFTAALGNAGLVERVPALREYLSGNPDSFADLQLYLTHPSTPESARYNAIMAKLAEFETTGDELCAEWPALKDTVVTAGFTSFDLETDDFFAEVAFDPKPLHLDAAVAAFHALAYLTAALEVSDKAFLETVTPADLAFMLEYVPFVLKSSAYQNRALDHLDDAA